MTHSMTIELPEAVYQSLNAEAQKKGRRVEEILVEKLAKGEPNQVDDPLDEFVGAFRSDVPDWADNHDKYLGDNLMREMRGENE